MNVSSVYVFSVVLAIFLGCRCLFLAQQARKKKPKKTTSNETDTSQHVSRVEEYTDIKRATFACGCFWCGEYFFQVVPGVIDVVCGYAGGNDHELISFDTIAKSSTGWRHAIQVMYDPEQLSYNELLELFRCHIDPEDEDGQYDYRGFHYSTAIYYHTTEQCALAEKSFEYKDGDPQYAKPLATEILPYTTFHLAHDSFQDYYATHPDEFMKHRTSSHTMRVGQRYW